MEDLVIITEYIHLDQALKLAGLAASGGEAKEVVRRGAVSVNGIAETRRGRKLRPGDVVGFGGIFMRIVWKNAGLSGADAAGDEDADGVSNADSAEAGMAKRERTGGRCVGKADRAD